MKKKLNIIVCMFIYFICAITLIELGVNYFSFKFLFPIKNSTSYGYITKKTNKTIIPLNKYSSRFKAQLALPYELINNVAMSNKKLNKTYNEKTKKYGYTDLKNKIIIDYKYDIAFEFENDFAIVAIDNNKTIKYGTIDKKGKWVIEPKYTHLCPFAKYYTKACIDNKHCGIIDRFGNEITLMSYKTDKLKCKDKNCINEFCAIGNNKKSSCNYFL